MRGCRTKIFPPLHLPETRVPTFTLVQEVKTDTHDATRLRWFSPLYWTAAKGTPQQTHRGKPPLMFWFNCGYCSSNANLVSSCSRSRAGTHFLLQEAVASSLGQSETEADWQSKSSQSEKAFLKEISGWNVSDPAAEQGYKKPLEVLQ